MWIKLEDAIEILKLTADNDGMIELSKLEHTVWRCENYNCLGGRYLSLDSYWEHSNFKQVFSRLKDSMFDPAKSYYSLETVIEKLLQYNPKRPKHSKQELCKTMGIDRPTLNSYLNEMLSFGHKPFFFNSKYSPKEGVNIVALRAFLLKKCELQNGLQSVAEFYKELGVAVE